MSHNWFRTTAKALLCTALTFTTTLLPAQPSPLSRVKVTALGGSTEASSSAGDPSKNFETAEAMLDKGGDLFMYISLAGVADKIIDAMEPMMKASGDRDVAQVPALARSIVKALGIDQLSDFAVSSAQLSDGTGRMKAFLALTGQKGVFQLFGSGGSLLEGLSLIPPDAVIACVGRMDVSPTLDIARKIAHEVAGMRGDEQIDKFLEEGRKHNFDVEKILASIGDEITVAVRLDSKNPIGIPTKDETKTISLPRPTVLVSVKVKDDTLYRSLSTVLRKEPVKTTLASGLPEGFEGITVQPGENTAEVPMTFASGAGRFFFSVGNSEIKAAIAARDSKKDITSTSDYKALTPGMPGALPDGVFFTSPRVAVEVAKAVDQIDDKEVKLVLKLMQAALGMEANQKKQSVGRLTYRINKDSGILWVTRGNVHAAEAVQAAAALPVAILTAIALPNFQEAQIRAKVARTKNDMRAVATSIETYYVDNNSYPEYTSDADRTALKNPVGGASVSSLVVGTTRGGASTLTTPVSYITSYPRDIFEKSETDTFAYYSTPEPKSNTTDKSSTPGGNWILYSPGPDGKFDLNTSTLENMNGAFDTELAPFTYDSSNGTVSGGDIIRTKNGY